MIEEAKEEHPRMPLSDLCELFGVSRSWYYKKRTSSEEKASEDVEFSGTQSSGSYWSSLATATAGSRRP